MTTASATQPRKLGRTGPAVFPIALGCMGMSGTYGPADEPESLATIHAAIDAGALPSSTPGTSTAWAIMKCFSGRRCASFARRS